MARNAGVAAATQPWVAFLDADDLWAEGKLAVQWEAINRWPDAGFCFTEYDTVYANGHVVPAEMTHDSGYALLQAVERTADAGFYTADTFVPALVRSMFVRQSSLVVNRELFVASGGYDERLRLAEDYDFLLRLIAIAPAIAVERSFVVYRRRADSLSADPLAEIRSIDALWATILERPQRYPKNACACIKRARAATLYKGAGTALRLGRFRSAAEFARGALTVDHSPRAAALLGASRFLATPLGTAVYRCARTVFFALRSIIAGRRKAAELP